MAVRTGGLISESITTLSKAVSVRGRFTKALKVLYLPFSVIPVIYCSSGHDKLSSDSQA